jgi:hypothetical protein
MQLQNIYTIHSYNALPCLCKQNHYMLGKIWFYWKTKLRGFSPPANYANRATAACRWS